MGPGSQGGGLLICGLTAVANFFSSKDEALDEARIQRIRLQNEGLEGFEFTLDQRLDAKIAMAVLAGSGLSLTQAAKIAVEFHGIQTSGIALNDAIAELLKAKQSRCSPVSGRSPSFGAWNENTST
jgi:hypothetical protein